MNLTVKLRVKSKGVRISSSLSSSLAILEVPLQKAVAAISEKIKNSPYKKCIVTIDKDMNVVECYPGDSAVIKAHEKLSFEEIVKKCNEVRKSFNMPDQKEKIYEGVYKSCQIQA